MQDSEIKVDKVETLLVLAQHRAKAFGEQTSKRYLPGDKYKQSGLDKLEVLGTGRCTRDLDAKVPSNPKRKKPEKGKESYLNPVEVLSAKIDKLVDVIAQLVTDKKK